MISIESIAAENLRGYESTELYLRELTVLVGENNEGKSSLLKMLDGFLQIPAEFWNGDQFLDDAAFEFWYPANSARKKGRRFTVNVKFNDGRTARRFRSSKGDVLALRFAVSSNGSCRLNIGAPRRSEVHDSKAEELLAVVKENVEVVMLPPIRDAKTSIFGEKATRVVKEKLKENIFHIRQAGTKKEYRLAKDAIRIIEEIISLHSGELSRSDDSPLASMLKSSEVRVELFPKDIYSLIEKSMRVYLSTGRHDELKVLPREVGNGLQSLIDINLEVERILSKADHKSVVLIVEEPEAFLHPSAQRQFMQFLRRALVEKVESAILTTHSPIILDEAKYEEIVLVRNQRHFYPSSQSDDRSAINTSLMTTASAEVFFARTVVFVEGEGDRAFFNTLLKKIKNVSAVCPELAGLVFQVTGGCTFYAPWLKLARSYESSGKTPFRYFWIMDGDSASPESGRAVCRAIRDVGFFMEAPKIRALEEFGDLGWAPNQRDISSVEGANEILRSLDGHLFACDLEWAFFNGASENVINNIKAAIDLAGINSEGGSLELARRLGSKINTGKSSDGAKKNPYVRTLIAEGMDLNMLPPEIYSAVIKILNSCYQSSETVDSLVEDIGLAVCSDGGN